MRSTEYFDRKTRDRGIERAWCEWVVNNPLATERQEDGRVRHWAYVEEAAHYIRVITEVDGTYVNAFFDRNFEKRRKR